MRWVMGSSVKTVKIKIYQENKGKADYLEETKKILDQALAFYQQLLLENPTIVEAEDNLRQVERLSHRTKDNPNPPYEAPELPSITTTSNILIQKEFNLHSFKSCKDTNAKKEIVREIKDKTGASLRELAKMLEVSKDTVQRLLK